MSTNRGKQNMNDEWLTPLDLVEALGGKFALDPCCPPVMPWKTAKMMLSNRSTSSSEAVRLTRAIRKTDGTSFGTTESDGLLTEWGKLAKGGDVVFNPPYSNPFPWVALAQEYGHAVGIFASKSDDARWAQLALATAHVTLKLKRRLYFCYTDGTPCETAWCGYMLCGWGRSATNRIVRAHREGLEGVLMVPR